MHLVRSGEESGRLQETFTYLADYLERAYYLKSKAFNAMMYPAFVIFAFGIVMTVMMIVILPSLLSIFEDAGQELPIYTKIIISFSTFIRKWGGAVFVLIAAGAVFMWRWAATEEGKNFFHKLQINVPLLGQIYRKIYMARLTDNLQVLIISGVPIIKALEITSDVVGNVVYRQALKDAIESVKGGNTISSAFERTEEIPALVTQMIRIGEVSGRLDFILGSVSKFYRKEVDSLLDNLVTLIEPVLILILGAAVAILVAAILVPLYSLVGAF